MIVDGVKGIGLIVLQFLSWMPLPFKLLIYAVFGIYGFYLTCKLIKLLWDVLPIA